MTTELGVATLLTRQALVVELNGSVVGSDADEVALRDAVSAMPTVELAVLDLRAVQLLTAGGARSVRRVVDRLQAQGILCRVVADADSQTMMTLRITGVHATVTVLGTVEEAVARTPPPVPSPPDASSPGAPADRLSDTLVDEFAALTQELLTTSTVDAALQRIATAALVIVPGADMVSVTLRDPAGAFSTPVATDPAATELDQVQYDAGTGPCVDAARPDTPAYVHSDDLTSETRWPQFAHAAADHGIASVLSTDLHSVDRRTAVSGALNIYAHHRGGLSARDRHAALLLAGHAALTIAYTSTSELAAIRQQNLRCALDTRDVIGQAKGILMVRQGMTADEAFYVLRRISQNLNVKLIDIARTLTTYPGALDTL